MQPEFYLERELTMGLSADEGPLDCGCHFHSHIELVAVKRGQMEAFVNDHHRVLRGGEMALALSYDAHCWRSDPTTVGIYMIIPTALCPEFAAAVENRKLKDPFICSEDLFITVSECYRHIARSCSPVASKGYLYVILGELLTHIQLEPAEEKDEPGMHRDVLVYLNSHYREDIGLSAVATALGYHPSYLSRAFKSWFRISVTDYITMLRLRHGVQLLKDPGKSITDCAFDSGFQSLRSFYRAFAEEFKCSPGQYRKTQR